MDNDGDLDALVGERFTGKAFGYENTGTASSPVWTAKSSWDTPSVGLYAMPALADLDNDGDYDLMIGSVNPGDRLKVMFTAMKIRAQYHLQPGQHIPGGTGSESAVCLLLFHLLLI